MGQTLTGTVGSWTGASGYSQQWQRCSGATCNPISTATGLTYVPVAADVGFTLRLQVTATNTTGPSLPANSAQTAAVTAATGSVPLNTGLPTVSGTAQVGQTLSGTVGSWTGASGYSQQWQRCSGASCNPISNATGLTYVPVAADVGFTLRLQVTASNTAGPSLPANSAQTAVVAATGSVPLNTALPTVTGTAQVGQTLSGTVGSWTGATSYGQQWQRCSGASCNPIGNATGLTYVPVAADVGFTLRLQVTASNTTGPSLPANSAQTAVVAAAGGGGSGVTDSFTRADALTLGTGWSTTNWFGASSCLLAISANQAAYPAGKSGGCHQYWTADNLADTVGSFTATALPPEGGEIDIGARIQNGGTSQAVLYEGAWLRHTAGPDTFYIVRRASNGSWATIATINGPDIAVGDQLAFKLAGTSLSLHRKPAGTSNWTQILAASDTTITGPGRLGLELYNATGAKADDWTISPDLPARHPSVPLNTSLPTISGTAQVGQTLTGTVGSWTGASGYGQQWQRCSGATCNPISTATGLTYVPVAADVGFTLRLQVTATNTTGPSLPANSAQTAAVTAATGSVPLNTALPTVSGTAQVGQTLSGTVGSWTGATGYSQQWQRCSGASCNPIGNATGLTYVPVAADVGFTLRLQVTASNTAGPSLPANSAQTAVVAAAGSVPLNTALPTVTGTAQVGQTLSGTVGSWTGATSYGQQWQRCSGASCNPIGNATGLTYVPVAADVGFTLRLQVTASNTTGPSLPANSAQTAVVAAAGGGGSGVTDSFTRADALTLGTGWSTTNWFGASSCLLAISANQAAYPAGKSGGCHQYWTADNLADTVGSFTATALPPEGGEIDIGARIQNGGTSQAVLYEGAWLRHTAGPDTFYIVRRASNGSWATIATINGPDIAVGDQLAFKLAGTSLSLHRKPAGTSNWTQILAASDTTITGPGRLGLELYNATGAKADDWTISPDLP